MRHKVLGLALATILAGMSLPTAATAAQAQTSGLSGRPAGAIAHDDDDDHDDDDECIDATQKDNVRVDWDGTYEVTVSTKGHRRPCAQTRVVFSVYVMPDTWDGHGFNETAFPQKHVQSTDSVVLSKHGATLKLKPVNPCFNVQLDVYYAPKITELRWPAAHGYQFISGRFRPAQYQ